MMPPASHAHEDALLDLAYGELPPQEATAVEAHVRGCVRCAEALDAIRGVRRAMAPLAEEPAPEAGLDSLLAYAEQAARRTREGGARRASPWRRWGLGLATAGTLVVMGVVAQRAAAPGASEPVAAALQEKTVLAQAPAPVPADAQALPPHEAAAEQMLGKAQAELAQRELAQRGRLRAERMRALEGLRARDGDRRADWDGEAAAEAPSAAAPMAAAPMAAAPKASAPGAEEAAEAEDSAGGTLADAAPAGPGGAMRAPPAPRAASARAAGQAAPGAETEGTPEGLARLAAAQRAQGDRRAEAVLLERALALGAAGPQRAALLVRLCEAELALGRTARARAACGRVLADFPGSPEADTARRLVGQTGEHP